jgi:branched-chain amino acid transport system permease protein
VSERRRLFPAMAAGRWALVGVALLALAVFPAMESDQYILSVFVTTMVLIVLNISWNFILGVAGVWNFGQLAIYALGGYGAGILMVHTGMPAAIDVVVGGLIGAVISMLMAIPTLRLFGIYTSLLTFAFAQIVQYVILNDGTGLTGGSFGFPIARGLYSYLSPIASMHAYYWTVLAVIVLSLLAVSLVTRSRLGIALRAIRDAPALAAARGVSPLRYRVIAFGLSGFLAGIAGALYLSFEQSISPSVMGLSAMSIDVTMLVIGGLGTIFGPVVGTTVVTIVETLLVSHPGVELTVVGAFLLVVVVFVPGGLVGLAGQLRRRIAAWVEDDGEEEDGGLPPDVSDGRARILTAADGAGALQTITITPETGGTPTDVAR